MKKIIYALSVCAMTLGMTSCSHTVYQTKTLYTNYASRMSSQKDLEIKSKVKIFLSESDIKGEYEVVSLNSYEPFCLFPIFSIPQKKLTKKFFQNAVKKAYDEGGNGILITGTLPGIGQFKVLNLKGWNSDDETASEYMNVIYDRENMDLFASEKLLNAKRSERVRAEEAFFQEIETNLQIISNQKEADFVRKKIDILESYGKNRSANGIVKMASGFNKKLSKIESKLEKRKAKTANSK